MKTHPFHVKKGCCRSRVNRKRYWAKRLKLLATGYFDTETRRELPGV